MDQYVGLDVSQGTLSGVSDSKCNTFLLNYQQKGKYDELHLQSPM